MAFHIVNIIIPILLFSVGESTVVNHIQMEDFENPATFKCVVNDKTSEQKPRSSDSIEFNLNFGVAGLKPFDMEFNGTMKCVGDDTADVDCSIIYNPTEEFVKSDGLDVEEVQYEIAATFVCDRKEEPFDMEEKKPRFAKLTRQNVLEAKQEKCVTSSYTSTMTQENDEMIGSSCGKNLLNMPSSTGEVICSQCCKGWYFDYKYKKCSECTEDYTTPGDGVYPSCSRKSSTTTQTLPIQKPTSPQTEQNNKDNYPTDKTTPTTTHPLTPEQATDPKTVFSSTDSSTLKTTKTVAATSKSTVTTSETKQEKTTPTKQDNYVVISLSCIGGVAILIFDIYVIILALKEERLCCFNKEGNEGSKESEGNEENEGNEEENMLPRTSTRAPK